MGPLTTLGLMLALIAAFLLDAFDRRPRDPRRLEVVAGLPARGPRSRACEEAQGLDEAFQRLRVRMDTIAESPPGVVVVTSAAPAEGKSSVAVGLVEAAGARRPAGMPDRGRPSAPAARGAPAPGRPGLADVLGGGRSRGRRSTVQPGDGCRRAARAARRRGVRRSSLARSGWARLLERPARRYDLVVVDSPPLPAAADA